MNQAVCSEFPNFVIIKISEKKSKNDDHSMNNFKIQASNIRLTFGLDILSLIFCWFSLINESTSSFTSSTGFSTIRSFSTDFYPSK